MSEEMSFEYQVGGTISASTTAYIYREADQTLLNSLLKGELCYVFNSRQMGKSSLLLQCKTRIEESGYRCAFLDLSKVGTHNISQEQWFAGLSFEIWRSFDFKPRADFFNFWQALGDVSPSQKFASCLEFMVDTYDGDMVIFFDEVDCVKSLDFPPDDFFSVIRAAFNARGIKQAYTRLQFAFFGVALPSDLISDTQRSPFNIGRSIALQGFTDNSCSPLAKGLINPHYDSEKLLSHILFWSGGQPFLTQKICEMVKTRLNELSEPLPDSKRWVDTLVEKNLIQDWQTHDNPQHLKTISDRLMMDPAFAIYNLETYLELLQSPTKALDVSDKVNFQRFELTGLVNIQKGKASLRAKLYSHVFTKAWALKSIAEYRPYQSQLSQWIESDRSPNYLLKDEQLSNVIQWSKDKHLPELDHQFISESQFLEKQRYHQWNQRLEEEISQRKETELRLQKALEELEQAKAKAVTANQAKSEFLARISHQVRTPINHIMGLTYLAEKEIGVDKLHHYITKISKSTSYLLGTVNDLVDINKLERRELLLTEEVIIVDELFDSIIDLISDRVQKADIKLNMLFPKSPLPVIKSDPLRIQQIIVNLLTNAIKFSAASRIDIQISLSRNNELKISIKDNGLGLNKTTYRDHIISEDDEFCGLGLKLCNYLATLMKGQMMVSSEPGIGSTFTVCLQTNVNNLLSNKETSSEIAMKLAVSESSLGNEVASVLKYYEYDVIILSLEQLKEGFDLSCIDIFMPTINYLHKPEEWITYFEKSPSIRIIPLSENGRDLPFWVKGTRVEAELPWPASPKRIRNSLIESQRVENQPLDPNIELSGNYHLLIVDDDEINREIVLELLKDNKFEISIAVNGQDALDKIEKNNYDLVLMDIEMPVMDGITATQTLRKRGYTRPIIAMTAHALLRDEERFKSAGMNDYISKPIEPEKLEMFIKRWLNDAPPEFIAQLQLKYPDIKVAQGLSQCSDSLSLYSKLISRFLERFCYGNLNRLSGHELINQLCSVKDQSINLGLDNIKKITTLLLAESSSTGEVKNQNLLSLDKLLLKSETELRSLANDLQLLSNGVETIIVFTNSKEKIKIVRDILKKQYKILVATDFNKLDHLMKNNPGFKAIISDSHISSLENKNVQIYSINPDSLHTLVNEEPV